MGAAFAGIIRVPLTSVIMIFEITRDYSIIVPLMISNLMAYYISSRLQEESVYEALQHQEGIHLPTGARAREALLMVGNAYRPEAQVLNADETVRLAAASVDRERGAWPVVESGRLRGMIPIAALDEALEAGHGEVPLREFVPAPGAVEDLTEHRFPHVHADHPLEVAMRRLGESGLAALPVVSRTDVCELKGTISLADILAAYRVGVTEAPGAEPAAAPEPARLLTRMTAVLIALAIVAGFLNYFFGAERKARAERYFQAGNELLAKGRADEAIVQLRNAVSASHSLPHRLALGLALQQAGQSNEASIFLNEVLRESPASGPANLGVARIDVAAGNLDRAILHYQRAAAGIFPDRPELSRFDARLELVAMLSKNNRLPQAMAELASAAAATPKDPVAFDRLARAQRSLGDEEGACLALRQALRLDRNDAAARKDAEGCGPPPRHGR
jgi:CBS domain-containing protein/Flp pilus assembly protein TadD